MGRYRNKFSIIGLIIFLFFSFSTFAEEHKAEGEHEIVEGEKGEFNPGEMITHHIMDSHEWHFATIGHHHYSIPLPVILYSNTNGLVVFSSSQFHNENHSYGNYHLDHATEKIHSSNHEECLYDISITKNVASLLLSALLLVVIFISIGNAYKKDAARAPKGIQSFFEPIIIFIRDDVARNIIGEKHYKKYLPYLLTVFFFIWFNNMLGLIPGGANLTGNIAVTMTLAVITFLITSFSGNKYYWGHIFNTPGVPFVLKFLIVPIEIVGLFTKPFSLMVRLFANITAGHIIILSLLGLIFIFENVFASLISLPFAIFMSFLELFVALLQAYIFTLLSAMYFSAAVEEHEHNGHDVDKALMM